MPFLKPEPNPRPNPRPNLPCPLCLNTDNSTINLFHKIDSRKIKREFFKCGLCGLIFVPSNFFSTTEEEKARYNEHMNGPDEDGYREYLSKFADEAAPYIIKGEKYLDFGSGPYPMLQDIFRTRGIEFDIYDYYFHKNESVFEKKYNLVTCSETVEHFHSPNDGFRKLHGLLKSGGYLVLMTSLYHDEINFDRWHYIQDNTHVSFYTEPCFDYICKEFGFELIKLDANIIVLQKS